MPTCAGAATRSASLCADKLVVYCWRLVSLEVTGVTPVPVAGATG